MSTNRRAAKQDTLGSAVTGGTPSAGSRVAKTRPDGTIDPSFISALSGVVPANTQRLHVDSLLGNDTTGTGSIAAPFATLQKAIDENAVAGGIDLAIILSPGTYLAPSVTDANQTVISILGHGQDVTFINGTLTLSNSQAANQMSLHNLTLSSLSDLYALGNPIFYLVNAKVSSASSANGGGTGEVRVYPGAAAPSVANLSVEYQAVQGPGSAVDGNVPEFDGTTGQLIADSGFPAALATPSDPGFMSAADKAKLDGIAPGSGADTQRETFTLTNTEITNEQLTVAGTISDADSVHVAMEGGGASLYGVDYTVSGNDIVWSGYDLSTILVVGSVLQITYLGT